MSPTESRVLRVSHVDDVYLALAGQDLVADAVALDEAYLSVFAVQEGDTLTIGGQAYRVTVRRGLLDMESSRRSSGARTAKSRRACRRCSALCGCRTGKSAKMCGATWKIS